MDDRADAQVTRLLEAWRQGDASAADELAPLVYQVLHSIASVKLRAERPGHTLQATALVHEAWLRLMQQHGATWRNRAQFYAIAARAMRRILVDYARKRQTSKRGHAATPVDIEDLPQALVLPLPDERLVALDEALMALADLDERQARVVELRFFGGLSVDETAGVLEISPATVKREWATARAWLFRAVEGEPPKQRR